MDTMSPKEPQNSGDGTKDKPRESSGDTLDKKTPEGSKPYEKPDPEKEKEQAKKEKEEKEKNVKVIADAIGKVEVKKPGLLEKINEKHKDGDTLIGKEPIQFEHNGVQHTIAFTSDRMILDGERYKFVALEVIYNPFGKNGDKELNLYNVSKKDDKLMFEAGALGKKGEVSGDAKRLEEILSSLTASGSYTPAPKTGQATVRITKE